MNLPNIIKQGVSENVQRAFLLILQAVEIVIESFLFE